MSEVPPEGLLTDEHFNVLSDLACEVRRHLCLTLGYSPDSKNMGHIFRAVAQSVRDRISENWVKTQENFGKQNSKRVHYFSLEFLLGRSLNNAVQNMDLDEEVRAILHRYSLELEELQECEQDAGLGNGGLGRLAACFLDSCSNLDLPVVGYGIRYEYGMFHQQIENGHQVESPDHWLRDKNVWEIERGEDTKIVQLYGHTERQTAPGGDVSSQWVSTHDVLAVPYDMPIPGFQNTTVNTLRLWKSAATDAFDLDEFNAGSYPEAVAQKNNAEQISMVLYPNDSSENGKELRLKQQYFLVSASLQDILEKWVKKHGRNFSEFGKLNCFQLNDTHPACAVPELMRLLIDVYELEWDRAWEITTQSMAYTNHTLLPEALERWPVRLFKCLLPRLMEIISEINNRFLAKLMVQFPDDVELRNRVSVIEEGEDPHIRMAYLSIVGSFSVNGVAQLHTELLKTGLFADFNKIWPGKFNNKTNGVTQRRWLSHCNPKLRELINETIGTKWESDLEEIQSLNRFADDPGFQSRWQEVKRQNKRRLSEYVEKNTGVFFDIRSMFDTQVKRIHEYKRQLLNVLHVIHLYDRICSGQTEGIIPRCVLIGGKAAPGYHVAKVIVKLINNVAQVVNQEAKTTDWLKVVFLPNYRVSAMEVICPGTDLSEQISTAGKEASGTGNMKFMMNGALTIGTLDGANIEIREKAGADNFFLFGMDAQGVQAMRREYDPQAVISGDEEISRILSLLEDGHFSEKEPGIFDVLISGLRDPADQWLTIADLRSYIDTQRIVDETYRETSRWTRMSILNVANSGWFSSDRTIAEYAKDIWDVQPYA
ncbi:MAG: glycogen/starch/alpha-glucan phosphorylase [Planctomycetota bacterium]|nr:glycogen/starch/alpha-glucan phosphorylase [Planctomycetota bacterium]